MSSISISTRHQRFTRVRLPDPHLTPSRAPFPHRSPREEYRPSRRGIAPFFPFGAFSYSATMASLYSRLNARRVGRGAGSGAPAGSACSPAAGRRGCSSDGVDTRTGSPVLPSRSGTPHSLRVAHISLTERGERCLPLTVTASWLTTAAGLNGAPSLPEGPK
jgi:hypothetical protein